MKQSQSQPILKYLPCTKRTPILTYTLSDGVVRYYKGKAKRKSNYIGSYTLATGDFYFPRPFNRTYKILHSLCTLIEIKATNFLDYVADCVNTDTNKCLKLTDKARAEYNKRIKLHYNYRGIDDDSVNTNTTTTA